MAPRSQYFWYHLFFFSLLYALAILLTLFPFIASLDHRVAAGRPDDEGLALVVTAIFGLLLDTGAFLIFRKSWPVRIICGATFVLGATAIAKFVA
ncbi:hypothetical protein [Microbispora sp. H11081]|uniref:hypothetical protein n=1 Tax=Microbispora sp. H11081 TaxID=2729107 RepID=UPI001472B4E4|nr:hypothetical protein [Microbispora sp. H11081]